VSSSRNLLGSRYASVSSIEYAGTLIPASPMPSDSKVGDSATDVTEAPLLQNSTANQESPSSVGGKVLLAGTDENRVILLEFLVI